MAKASHKAKAAASERLRASPNFALAFTMDGRPYVAKEVEPYTQYWLTDRYRVLLSLFSNRRGATVADAIKGYLRLTRTPDTDATRARLYKAIEDMRNGSVLVRVGDDASRYTAHMAHDYLTHRPFPRDLAHFLVFER